MDRGVRDEGRALGGKAVSQIMIDQIVRQQEEIEDLRRRLADSKAKQEGLSHIVEDAFREGFRSVATYNDTVLNDEDEEWRKYQKGLAK